MQCLLDPNADRPSMMPAAGKQSLARLAAFLCGYEVFTIAVSATYGINEFKAVRVRARLAAGRSRMWSQCPNSPLRPVFHPPVLPRRTCSRCTPRRAPRACPLCCC